MNCESIAWQQEWTECKKCSSWTCWNEANSMHHWSLGWTAHVCAFLRNRKWCCPASCFLWRYCLIRVSLHCLKYCLFYNSSNVIRSSQAWAGSWNIHFRQWRAIDLTKILTANVFMPFPPQQGCWPSNGETRLTKWNITKGTILHSQQNASMTLRFI